MNMLAPYAAFFTRSFMTGRSSSYPVNMIKSKRPRTVPLILHYTGLTILKKPQRTAEKHHECAMSVAISIFFLTDGLIYINTKNSMTAIRVKDRIASLLNFMPMNMHSNRLLGTEAAISVRTSPYGAAKDRTGVRVHKIYGENAENDRHDEQ